MDKNSFDELKASLPTLREKHSDRLKRGKAILTTEIVDAMDADDKLRWDFARSVAKISGNLTRDSEEYAHLMLMVEILMAQRTRIHALEIRLGEHTLARALQ